MSVGPSSVKIPELKGQAQPEYDPQKLREQLALLLSQPDLLPDKFLGFMVDYLSVNQPLIPVSQLFGFSQFTANHAFTSTSETTTSTTYTDLTTSGPTLSGLSDGNYLVLHGFTGYATDPRQGYQSISVNGAAAADAEACLIGSTLKNSTMTGFVKKLSSGSNSLQAKYRINDTGTAGFENRILIALKYANI